MKNSVQLHTKDLSVIFLACSKVFCNSMATVIGPTPPGTGVIQDATSLTSLKSTSPTNLFPDFLEASKIMQTFYHILTNIFIDMDNQLTLLSLVIILIAFISLKLKLRLPQIHLGHTLTYT